MKAIYIIAGILIVLVTVLVICMNKQKENYYAADINLTPMTTLERLESDPYIDLLTKPVPRVGGVSFPDSNAMLFYSMINGGMMSNDVLDKIAPKREDGTTIYEKQTDVINSSLELDKSQELQRYHLAAALSQYIPPEGVPTSTGLWYQRNYIQNLDQPGLYPEKQAKKEQCDAFLSNLCANN